MKWKSYISTTDWQYNVLVLLAFFIPLNKRIIPLLIAICVVVAITKSIIDRKVYREKSMMPLLLLAGLYFLHVAGLGLTNYPDNAMAELEIKASFLVFPLLAIFLPQLTRLHIQKIADGFTTSVLLFLAISVSYGIKRSIEFDDWSYLTYDKLGIFFHPTYMAVYQCMALMWLFLRAGQMRHLYNNKILHWTIASAVVLYINLLESKAGILSAFLVIGHWLWSERHDRLRLKNAGINSSIILIVLLSGMFFLPSTFGRLKRAVEDVNAAPVQEHVEATSSTALRKVTLTASWEIFSTHPLGVGIGNVTPELVKIYEESGEQKAATKELNAHNQFLQTGAEIGWPGLFLLLAFLWMLWRRSFHSSDILFQSFVLLCGFNFLFESFLEVQAGIVFFCFWSLVFLKYDGR